MPLRQLSRSRVRSWFVFAIVASLGAGLLAGLAYALVATVRGHANARLLRVLTELRREGRL